MASIFSANRHGFFFEALTEMIIYSIDPAIILWIEQMKMLDFVLLIIIFIVLKWNRHNY